MSGAERSEPQVSGPVPSRAERAAADGPHVIPSGAPEGRVVEGSPTRRMARCGRSHPAPFGNRTTRTATSPPRLCLWRQPRHQTVPLATTRRTKRLLVVAGDTVWLEGCRQRHSFGPFDPAAQYVRTVFRSLGWRRAFGHPSERNTIPKRRGRGTCPSQRTEYRSHCRCRCRRASSLGAALSSGVEFVPSAPPQERSNLSSRAGRSWACGSASS